MEFETRPVESLPPTRSNPKSTTIRRSKSAGKSFDQEAYDDFWYWINERHRIYLKKTTGRPQPWTKDPILQNWKFCNPFRSNDKQSQLLFKNVIQPHWNDDPALMLFNIYVFRAFNWWDTYEALVRAMGRKGWLDRWDADEAVEILRDRVDVLDMKLTSGAYMIRGREGIAKYESIVSTLDHIWRKRKPVAHLIKNTKRLEKAQQILMEQEFWGWGNFTTYQIVLDLLTSPLMEGAVDVNTWCEFGPGAVRGLRCIWPHLPSTSFLKQAKQLHSQAPNFLESHVPAMTLQDIEFSLCELSKYRRIKEGGKGKEGYRNTAEYESDEVREYFRVMNGEEEDAGD